VRANVEDHDIPTYLDDILPSFRMQAMKMRRKRDWQMTREARF
jgi:hypothetical protein